MTQKMNYHCLGVSMQSYSGGGGCLSLCNLKIALMSHLECQKERVINVTFCCYADKLEKNIKVIKWKKKNCCTDQCLHWKITPSEMVLDNSI